LFIVLILLGQVLSTDEYDEYDTDTPAPEPVQAQSNPVPPKPAQTRTQERQQQSEDLDDDEFITHQPEQHRPTEPPKSQAVEQDVKVPSDWPGFLTFWGMELLSVTILAIYGLNFYLGSTENEHIATSWGKRYLQLFSNNFQKVGDVSPIVKQSQNVFTLSATGRQHCVGLHSIVELKRRHDLMFKIIGMFSPSYDKLTIDIAMDNDMAMMVLGIFPNRNEKSIKKEPELKDILRFAKYRQIQAKAFPSDKLVVYSDSLEVVEALDDAGVFHDLAENHAAIESIHVTDQCLWNSKYKKSMRLVFLLPDARNMDSLESLMDLSMYLIDVIGKIKLSPQANTKACRAREDHAAAQRTKDDVKQEQERKQEEKYKRDQEALEKMSPGEREKEEKRRAKKILKKKQNAKVKVMYS